MAVYARKQYIHVCSEDTSRRLGRRTPGSVGREVWVPNASNCWIRDILSVSSSRISTNCPDLILSTSFLGKGSDAGDRLNPARDVLGSRTCEVVVAATAGVVNGEAIDQVSDAPPWAALGISATEATAAAGGRLPRPMK